MSYASTLSEAQKRAILASDENGALPAKTRGQTLRCLMQMGVTRYDREAGRYALNARGIDLRVTLKRLDQAPATWKGIANGTRKPRPAVEQLMSEDDFQHRVIDYARAHGWKVVHYRPARTAQGYRTPLQGDRGCPDLILARKGTVLLVELKKWNGTTSLDQLSWLKHLGSHARLWRPADWPAIEQELA